jgi:D-3-phosphoglycerate dehydrogenase
LQFRYAPLAELLAESDAVSLHAPPPADGRPLLDAAALALTRRGVLLINTARHDLMDCAAVRAALDSGQVGGAAIDVFDREPPGDRGLVGHPRVIATPHVGGLTDESVDRAVAAAVTNLLDALGTKPPSAREHT